MVLLTFYFLKFDLDYSTWSELNWFTSRAMSSMWGNFAKLGDPTPPGAKSWSTFFSEKYWMQKVINLHRFTSWDDMGAGGR